uniref:Prenyl transferase n=1 Tax=Polysiphonia sertularioides TaxID=945028 RepID=A0A1Z1M9C7_9FLOR|nr:prenyl transferase [Polysiphonia sertularioides]ARW62502.1 prenyl transferase [Polysiphonia sertularioides]
MRINLKLPIKSIEKEVNQLNNNLYKMITTDNAILHSAAEQLFSAGGKRIRPIVIFNIAKFTSSNNNILIEQKRLAEITEIIHTASLVHDDIIDNCETRRGVNTIHNTFSNKIAVLTGDFLFAQSSWYLANLNNLNVVKIISKIIIDFAEGEIKQGVKSFNSNISMQEYIEKSFYKTASLIACSSKATVLLNSKSQCNENDFYLYGKHIGLAFQIIDDILDITSTSKELGKPAGLDLKNGNLTATLIFTLNSNKQIYKLINQEFQFKNDISTAMNIIKKSNSIQKAKDLALEHIQLAIHILEKQKLNNKNKKNLILLCYYILNRFN